MNLSFALFDRPLREEFRYGRHALLSRRGVVLRRRSESGISLYSEASPLPSHSRDTLEEVVAALESPFQQDLPPSLRFALESLELLAAPEEAFHPVRTNALARWRGLDETGADIDALAARGFRHIKIKLPASAWPELATLLASHPGLQFRLDANAQLDPHSLDELLNLLEAKGASRFVDYIEEPFSGFWESPNFAGAPLSFAADESACDAKSLQRLLEARNPPAVFVLKPAVYGGLQSLEPLVRKIESNGLRAVFTSTLECEPGRRALLAFLGRRRREASGLSTGCLFARSYFPDQAEWKSPPEQSPEELSWLDSLQWQECRW